MPGKTARSTLPILEYLMRGTIIPIFAMKRQRSSLPDRYHSHFQGEPVPEKLREPGE
jgi:hypothetical protein